MAALPVFGTFEANGFYTNDCLSIIRGHIDIPALYSVIMDIPSTIWQESTVSSLPSFLPSSCSARLTGSLFFIVPLQTRLRRGLVEMG
jgi:hypothetical protein